MKARFWARRYVTGRSATACTLWVTKMRLRHAAQRILLDLLPSTGHNDFKGRAEHGRRRMGGDREDAVQERRLHMDEEGRQSDVAQEMFL